MNLARALRTLVWLMFTLGLVSCGGGNSTSASSSSGSPVSMQLSGASTLTPLNCGMAQPSNPVSGTTESVTSGSAVQPQAAPISSSSVAAVWEQDRWSGPGARAILASHSTDAGATWSSPAVLPLAGCGGGSSAYDRVSDPWLTVTNNGTLVASALAFSASNLLNSSSPAGPSAVLVSSSTDGGVTWSAPSAVIADANTAGTIYFNDRDSATADAAGNVYVTWDRLSNSGGSTPAYLAQLTNNGQTLGRCGVLYDPGGTEEAFNNQIAVLPNGTVLDVFTRIVPTAGTPITTLEVLQVNTGSFTAGALCTGVWSATAPGSASATPNVIATISVNSTTNPTPAGSPAIRDSWVMAQVAVDPSSTRTVAAVWLQSPSAINTSFNAIALSVSSDGGQSWSPIKLINGNLNVAAFNPTVRYLPGGVLAVTYYDLRDYVTGSSTLGTDTWLTESSDGGASWHEVRLQGPFDLNQAPLTDAILQGFPSLFLGDNQGLAAIGGSALPVYAATNSTGAHIYATTAPNPLTLSTAHAYAAQ